MSQRAFSNIPKFVSFLIISTILISPYLYCHLKIPPITLVEPVIFLAAIILMLKNLKSGESFFKKDALDISLLFFLLFVALQILYGKAIFNTGAIGTIYNYRTEWGMVRGVSYVFLFWIIKNYFTGEKEIQRLIFTCLAAGTALACIAIFQKLFDPAGTKYTFFLNRNHFAGYLEMVFPLIMGMLLYRFSKRQKERQRLMFFAVSMIIIGFSIFISLSRAGIISFVGSLIFFSILLGKKKAVFYIFLIILVITLLALWAQFDPMMERFSMFKESLQYRANIYSATIELIRDYPLFGTGFNTFEYAFARYQPNASFKRFNYADNDYLQLISETGLIGAFIFFTGLFLFLLVCIRRVLNTRDPFIKYIGSGCLAGIFAMVIHSFVDFNLRIHSNAILFFVMLGIIGNICAKKPVYKPGKVFYLPIILLLIGLFVFSLIENAAWSLKERNTLKDLKAASALSLPNAEYSYLLSQAYIEKAQKTKKHIYFKNALGPAREASRKNPLYYKYKLNLARIHYFMGDYDRSEEYYKQYVSLDPHNAHAYLHYAIFSFNRYTMLGGSGMARGFFDKGMVLYEKALSLNPGLDLKQYEDYILPYDELYDLLFR